MLVDKLQVIEDKFMDLEQRISDPEMIAKQDEWQKLTRQHASLTETVETFRSYKRSWPVLMKPWKSWKISLWMKSSVSWPKRN